MNVIEFSEFGFTYRDGDEAALTGVDLSINRQEIVLITGPSGAGKTTLCMALNGLVPQLHRGTQVGSVRIDGRLDNEEHPVPVLSRTCGLLFQDPDTQLVAPTVRDEIAFGPENYCLPPEQILERIEELVDLTRLRRYMDRNPHYLSGGEKQACALAATLAMSPSILVLDEPTSNIDPVGTTVVFDLLKRLTSQQDLTILLVEHKLDELLHMVDRVIVIDGGKLVLQGTPDEIMTELSTLEELGLSIPPVTVLMDRLRTEGFAVDRLPLSVAEAVDQVRNMLPPPERVRPVAEQIERPTCRVCDNSDAVIAVRDLKHRYDDGTEALTGVDLKIYRGEFVAILGQNGSGKTTLVKHFNGLLRPTAGQVLVNGKNTAGQKISDLSSHIGYVFQDPDAQIFKAKVREEIAYGPKNMGLSSEEVDARVEEAAGAIGIKHLLDRNTFFLSKGEKQRVAVAGVLSMKPDVIVLDEPTTGQDERGSHEIMRLARELNEQGRTVVVITHNMALAAEYCDRVVIMKSGRMLLSAPVYEAFANPDLLAESALKKPQLMEFASELREYGLPDGFRNVTDAVDFFVKLRQVLSQ